MRFLILAVLCLAAQEHLSGASSDSIAEARREFVHPPDSARPWVFWHWINGNVSREGITADLEAMQRVGIGGVVLFDLGEGAPPGPVRFDSEEWHSLFRHAVAEAARLGLQISVHNSPGWSCSGGPWITEELGMKQVVSSRTNLNGPGHFSGLLAPLPDEPSCRPIATLAFPALPGEGGRISPFHPSISCSEVKDFDPTNLLDDDLATLVSVPLPGRKPVYLQLEFDLPFSASRLNLEGAAPEQHFQGMLSISNDGHEFTKVRDFRSVRRGIHLAFEELSARYFRIEFTQADSDLKQLTFADLELTPTFQIKHFRAKAGLGTLPPDNATNEPAGLPAEAAIAPDHILDLSTSTDTAGRLTWEVPAGRWTVLRLACAPLNTKNRPAQPEGTGLETDKLNATASEAHFNAFVAKLVNEAALAAPRTLTGTLIDSWEVGFQNWTPRFREEFQKRRGYDPLPFYPALTGRYVASSDQSERFLWDMRRTIADLLADNFAARFAELAHQRGLQLAIEAYASVGGGPFDELLYGSKADVPVAEFWLGEPQTWANLNLRAMPSVAHTWGRQVVAAEAFTSYPTFSNWREHPCLLKPWADAAFCEGINQLMIHTYVHQPWLDRRPGVTLDQLGLHYERTQTWWDFSAPWHQYLARCQQLLRGGLFVADICYLTQEGAFTQAPAVNELNPPPPPGIAYDVACPEVVLKRMSVRNGRLTLPDGMSYAALVLAPCQRMTPELLRRLKQLVEAGATIVGERPVASPSLANYPQCDREVTDIAAELWGSCDGQKVTEHPFGLGRVVWGKDLTDVLDSAGIKPDLQTQPAVANLKWIHRRLTDADFYFIANPLTNPVSTECTFRVSDAVPEFWHADSGEMERPAMWRREGNRTVVPLRLDASESIFVVLARSEPVPDPVASLSCNNQPDSTAKLSLIDNSKYRLLASEAGTYLARTASGRVIETRIEELPPAVNLSKNWSLTFPPGQGAPAGVDLASLISWTEHADPGVKYFSGTATYSRNFELPSDWFKPSHHIELDLGRVQVIAEVTVNGKSCGVLWKPPFAVEITGAAHAGTNTLEVKVVNLWPNRLIGDEQLPQDCRWKEGDAASGCGIAEWPTWLLEGKPSPTGRLTFSTWKHWTKDSRLLESGWLGPVTVRVTEERILE